MVTESSHAILLSKKKSYPVQQNLRSWLESEPAVLEKVRRDASLVSLSYRKGSIVGIGKKDKLESAALLLEIHLKHQMELERLRVEKQKLSAKLEEQRKKVESGFRVEFGIERSLIGLAVGKGGSNIKRVKQETGVDVIKINNDDEVIIIIGKDEQCVNEARMQLEFVSVEYDVPEGSAGALIGKKGENIKKITAKSKVERIKFRDSSSTKLEILGTRRACEDAKMIIDADLQFMREREALDRYGFDCPFRSVLSITAEKRVKLHESFIAYQLGITIMVEAKMEERGQRVLGQLKCSKMEAAE
uniref:K Homology domain-containing protein n=1 Tax=Palpitomonas bilix TaxID=652834 RepID=A0A7S3GET9_9EUKA|mmetsp:Transcript_4639/g.9609  ORF Transcript_4639/g.9609 Transcript_4639/m.9609 type:complete len:303 (+) Transcript_4639:498-1406(+)